jgi:hypothetical protein
MKINFSECRDESNFYYKRPKEYEKKDVLNNAFCADVCSDTPGK